MHNGVFPAKPWSFRACGQGVGGRWRPGSISVRFRRGGVREKVGCGVSRGETRECRAGGPWCTLVWAPALKRWGCFSAFFLHSALRLFHGGFPGQAQTPPSETHHPVLCAPGLRCLRAVWKSIAHMDPPSCGEASAMPSEAQPLMSWPRGTGLCCKHVIALLSVLCGRGWDSVCSP